MNSATGQDVLPLDIEVPAAPSGRARIPAVEFADPVEGPVFYTTMDTPLGELLLTGDGRSLTGLAMVPAPAEREGWRCDPAPFREAVSQLNKYFAGELREFALPLAPAGTPFQRRVWRALTTVPYGTTTSYGVLAAEIGVPTGSRAVGMANGRNPLSIVVPCHRVIGANGSLTGYAGGLDRKQFLLSLEARGPQ